MRIVLRLLAGVVAIYALTYGWVGVSTPTPALERIGWGAFFLLAVGYFGWFSLTGRRLASRTRASSLNAGNLAAHNVAGPLSRSGCLWALKQLAVMIALGVAILVAVGLLRWGPLNDGKAGCTFDGDSLAVGATVYADGKWVGVMQATSISNNAVLLARIRRGAHQLLVVSTAGDSLATVFHSRAEASVQVSFADRTIHAD